MFKKCLKMSKALNDGNAHDISDLEMAPPYKYHLKISSGEPKKLICIQGGTQGYRFLLGITYSTLTRLNSKRPDPKKNKHPWRIKFCL